MVNRDFSPWKIYATHGEFLVELINALGFEVIAEVGVCHGNLAAVLLRFCPRIRDYYLVDPWARYPDRWREADSLSHWTQEQWDKVFAEVLDKLIPYEEKTHVLRMSSVEGARQVKEASLDLVYIDALHHYEPMMEDIRAWWLKVRPTGMLAGHDWWDDGSDYAQGMIGVMEAVLETFPREIIHIGSPASDWDHVWFVWKRDFEGRKA